MCQDLAGRVWRACWATIEADRVVADGCSTIAACCLVFAERDAESSHRCRRVQTVSLSSEEACEQRGVEPFLVWNSA